MNSKKLTVLTMVVLVAVGALVLLSGSTRPLVALSPLTDSSLSAAAELAPVQPLAGEKTKMTFTFTDASGKSVTDLMVHHGRHVHVVIVSKDLATLGHIHPTDFSSDMQAEITSGVYSVEYAFPNAGEYIVAVDVMNDADTLSQQFLVNVTGSPAMASAALADMSLEKCFQGIAEQGTDRYVDPVFVSQSEVACPGGYKVTLSPASKSLVAGQDTLLRFHFEKDGKPVTNLAPYLNAALHLAIVPESLDFVLHRHGSVDEGGHDAGSEMETGHDSMVMDLSGIHIMADGSVMLGNGKTVHDATVSADGMIHMPDGSTVKPAMDMRPDSGASTEGMEGMHHHDDVPASFGPDLVSEPIQFTEAGMYRIFASAKSGNEIIIASFMVKVEAESAAVVGESKSFELAVKNKKVIFGNGDIQVNEGDTVTLTVTNDTDEDVHLHGYDASTELKAGVPGTITFKASASGRFPLELEGSKTDIGAVSVLPR